jgi:hypothetical protein
VEVGGYALLGLFMDKHFAMETLWRAHFLGVFLKELKYLDSAGQ